jgi:hypothetical protein
VVTGNVGRPSGQRLTVAVVGAVSLLVLAACGTTTSATGAATSRRTSPTTASPAPSSASPAGLAEQRAIAAYLGMWQDFAQAGTTSDWQSPTLAQYATGIALSNMSRGLYADHYNDLVTRGTATHNPHVTSADPPVDPTKVVITDCSDSTNYLKYNAKTGQAANDGPGGRQLITGIVQKQTDGSWKVSDFGVHGVGTC